MGWTQRFLLNMSITGSPNLSGTDRSAQSIMVVLPCCDDGSIVVGACARS